MWRAAVVLCTAGLAGCGGDPMKDWARATERDCREAAAQISGVPPLPVTLRDLSRAAPDAQAVLEDAYTSIERREVPDDGQPAARPFLRELGRLRSELDRASKAARDEDVDRIGEALLAASRVVPALERAAARAGVRDCGDPREMTALLDAGRAPVFLYVLQQVGVDTRRLVARALRETEAARGVRAKADVLLFADEPLEEAHTRISGLDNPTWAEDASDEYLDRMDDVNNAMTDLWDAYETVALGALSRRDVQGQLRRGRRKLERAVRAEARAARELERLMRERMLGEPGVEGQIGQLS